MKMSKEYTYLFNTITDMIGELERLKNLLVETQIKAEEMYISEVDEEEKIGMNDSPVSDK